MKIYASHLVSFVYREYAQMYAIPIYAINICIQQQLACVVNWLFDYREINH